ncbi:L-histidine N(alpha)-methyltransferase [Enhydrobacter sp.]|jgi:dimethylhistidine N-methyltransferase|uniref:L-histidine N(alpha)-methyltransferase n=1 Tax=Enhydrobacter sp. TaxID=1894999 RepID=UPI002608EFF5|nr:L-histidine N(alpha)-methyltransferase [Enhydrobacter sp.]WIM13260.1 MAG: SAM-dependent methyltransferase [Enhydrobacter sp.]
MNGLVLEVDRAQTADREDFRRAVLDGLSRRPRAIPAKFLYDARGSALFDEICDLPEYYLTRTETAILRDHAGDIAALAGPDCALIEFGSGSSVKSRLLLDAMKPALYAPIDISREHLDRSIVHLRRDYPSLPIEGVCADYMTFAGLPPLSASSSRRIGFFPGSSIGNLEPHEALAFFRRAWALLGENGALVLGVDLKKDPGLLHAAYNDSAGVTAAFTLNLLRRMNRELQATFDLGRFAHEAFYNPVAGRIEIYFRSLGEQTVTVAGRPFAFADGERVHTEYSYKYDIAQLRKLTQAGGFRLDRVWTDPDRLFAVAYLTAFA